MIAKVCSGHTKREKKGLTLSHLTVLVKPQAAQIYLQSVHPNVLRIVQYCISRHEKPLHCYIQVVKYSELGQNVLSSMGKKDLHSLFKLLAPSSTHLLNVVTVACKFCPGFNSHVSL